MTMNPDPASIASSSYPPPARAIRGDIAAQVSLERRKILPTLFRTLWISKPSSFLCAPGLTMTQRPAIPAERGSRNVTNSDQSVVYARGESLSVGIGNRTRRSKYRNGSAWRYIGLYL
jgi:hypothetical protein